eukprot:TRINITY_DN8912_c0_g1_i1.p1 TRINITY_DN8912_c0_g1~~TRINITY_DN8912_c0_g1_i1.p1  ORF type:complete len:142 (+),score=35.22 TRINITY_DN8912_c0_g1_i1:59-427(+)
MAEDWEMVSEAASDCSSWAIAEYPGVPSSEQFDESVSEATTAPGDGTQQIMVAAHARARNILRMQLQPFEAPTEVQRVKKDQKPKVEVIKGGKHWQSKQALLAKANNARQQYHRRSKMQSTA